MAKYLKNRHGVPLEGAAIFVGILESTGVVIFCLAFILSLMFDDFLMIVDDFLMIFYDFLMIFDDFLQTLFDIHSEKQKLTYNPTSKAFS